ncbi:MAG TPA: hypothetical protein VG225_15455 [Terracidiphilus sp.]|jgi:hypothetical protein|nr:hypothetical protein [Terracidiphilus sp.]
MTYAVRGLGLVFSLVLVSTLAACSLVQLDSQAATASTTTSTGAYVYIQIQGPEGSVYGFRASPTGHLSPIHGSPFKPAGEIVGGTPTKFFTLGKDLVHSYTIAPDGAIGLQMAQIPIFEYAGSRCGGDTTGVNGAVLDHTGKYVYVLLEDGGDWSCSAYQTYKINSDGSFSFDGDTEENWGDQIGEPDPYSVGLPSILGNESFAYADESAGHESSTVGFRREDSGALQVMPQFAETDPTLANGYYVPYSPDASPSGSYVVVQLYPDDGTPAQLASYTVDSVGNISTTNTSNNMPTSAFPEPRTTFSRSGNLFVAYEDGIEIYKFNGAAPLTLYKTLLYGTPIDDVKWDGSNHMYAISSYNSMLYVFTVTSTSVTEDTALSIGSPFKMVVVSE